MAPPRRVRQGLNDRRPALMGKVIFQIPCGPETYSPLSTSQISLRLVRRFRPPFLAHDVAFAPDSRRAWISSGDQNELAVYDVRSGSLPARPYGAAPPQHVSFTAGLAFVTSGWSGTLRVHRIDGRSLARTVVPVGSYNVQEALGWVVTPALGRGFLTVCDDRGRLRRSERIARSSHDACIVAA